MYLTKIPLTLPIVREYKLRDAYSIHCLVYSSFSIRQDRRRLLYVEKQNAKDAHVLLLSDEIPNLPPHIEASTLEISESFFANANYRFEIIINPVRTDSKTKKREPILGQLPLLNWFIDHSVRWGFEVSQDTLEVKVMPSLSFQKGSRVYRFHKVCFKGILRVTDIGLFKKSFEAGLGHAKAFGFGLLQLQPINQ